MADTDPTSAFYRGGFDLTPRLRTDVVTDPFTGLLKTTRGVSLFDNPALVEKFGGACLVEFVPDGLQIVQRGRNPHHFELVPATSMTFGHYTELLAKVILRAPITQS